MPETIPTTKLNLASVVNGKDLKSRRRQGRSSEVLTVHSGLSGIARANSFQCALAGFGVWSPFKAGAKGLQQLIEHGMDERTQFAHGNMLRRSGERTTKRRQTQVV